jgi:hypothetical protein
MRKSRFSDEQTVAILRKACHLSAAAKQVYAIYLKSKFKAKMIVLRAPVHQGARMTPSTDSNMQSHDESADGHQTSTLASNRLATVTIESALVLDPTWGNESHGRSAFAALRWCGSG